MPSNKNAVTRYKYLDELLSDRHHYYDIHDLTEKCNEKLVDAGFPEVTQRCIEKDINYLEYAPFSADIERFRIHGKRCLRYGNPSFSIFTKELSDEESNLLKEVLSTIGQFDGLDNFEWLERFKIGLGLKERQKVISFSNNPFLKNSNLMGLLFNTISNKVVIELSYHTFSDFAVKSIVFHPYLLKQYNNRWFLLGAADVDKAILTFALDRIDGINSIPEMKYYPCTVDLEERFEDIIGVTLPKNKEAEDIHFWVSNEAFNYIITKPLHKSQKEVDEATAMLLKQKFPQLGSGHFIYLRCIDNYELRRELCSFFDGLIVLSPVSLKDAISKQIFSMNEKYFSVRT
jgi:predicted DNA-binding transcriptional regulator YafY